ncbi:carbohydrate binding domain-containing protein [Serratia sp. JUb9]|uniref:carbohydrate binding domain-containing protein n=1 Tax=Serratia sp. JUb9 TaxID=2724469 RepID=UPI00164D30C1|nr:carbohydrate binding domain-containing protein [Serratia sp. JUb9]QNK33172.1 carbohydrate binding domain-containing protein [Serratia sp. JUb9]
MNTQVQSGKKVDLVIVIDTSGSMADEAKALSAALDKAVEEARKSCPSDLRVEFLGIEGTFTGTKFEKTVHNYLTTTAGADGNTLKGRKRDSVANAGAQEDVARAVEDISTHFDWRAGAEKNVFVLGDESLEGGEMILDAARIKACNDAIATALSNGAKVHTYLGTPHATTPYPTPEDEEANIKEYKRLALRTGGEHYIYTKGIADFTQVLKDTICASKIPQQESIEDKKDEADNLEGKAPSEGDKPTGNGSNLCEQLPEIVKAVNTLADVLKGLVEACGPGNAGNAEKSGCKCHEHTAPVETPPSPPAPEPTPVPPPFSESTDFTGNQLNNWQFGPATPEHKFYTEDGKSLIRFPTTNVKGRTHNGVLLYKKYTELQPGKRYRFSIRARRDNDYKVIPELSLRVAGSDITPLTTLKNKGEWLTLTGEFTAAQGENLLEIFSHKASGDGNDFSITDIKVEEI